MPRANAKPTATYAELAARLGQEAPRLLDPTKQYFIAPRDRATAAPVSKRPGSQSR